MAELFGVKSARLYAIGIGLTFAILLALAPRASTTWLVDQLLLQALTSASWIVAGLAALASARNLEQKDREEGVESLVEQRGHTAKALELSRVLAAAVLIAARVGLPLLFLIAVGWMRLGDWSLAGWFFGWSGFVVIYAAALGLVLGVLARVAARISPERGRVVLVLLIALPELGRVLFPNVPSVPSAFGWALERVRGNPALAHGSAAGAEA